MYSCLSGQVQWDQLFGTTQQLQAEMRWLSSSIAQLQGSSFWPAPEGVVLVGDASETQYAACTPNGELPAAIVVPFTAEERERMLRKELSSTLREVCCLERSLPQVLQRLVYYADSQTAAAAINRIIGGAAVYAAVKHIYGMCLQAASDRCSWR